MCNLILESTEESVGHRSTTTQPTHHGQHHGGTPAASAPTRAHKHSEVVPEAWLNRGQAKERQKSVGKQPSCSEVDSSVGTMVHPLQGGSTTFNDKQDLQIGEKPNALLRMDLEEPNEGSQNEDIIRPHIQIYSWSMVQSFSVYSSVNRCLQRSSYG
jgi:hypothetical protein